MLLPFCKTQVASAKTAHGDGLWPVSRAVASLLTEPRLWFHRLIPRRYTRTIVPGPTILVNAILDEKHFWLAKKPEALANEPAVAPSWDHSCRDVDGYLWSSSAASDS